MATNNHTSETITIPLTQGQSAIVDAIDADLAQFKWHAHFAKNYSNGGNFIAQTRARKINGDKNHIAMHRVIMERIVGRPLEKGEFVDHRDNNPLNNIRGNLRIADRRQNGQNRMHRTNSKSGLKGVSWRKTYSDWAASIRVDGKLIHLDFYKTPEEAHAAYCAKAKELFGEFFNPG